MAMNGMGGESLADTDDVPTTVEAMNETIADGTPELASAFLQCVEDLIEALQQISRGAGPWSDDAFTHATNCIEHMQGLAVDVLRKHGLRPRGEAERVAQHEARHSVIARKLGIQVARASAADGDARVTTRHQTRDLEKTIVVDLAGTIGDSSAEACEQDEDNAAKRAMCLVGMRHGIAEDAAPSVGLRAEAALVVERARKTAANLVAANQGAIMRVAGALAKGSVLGQAEIDKLIAE